MSQQGLIEVAPRWVCTQALRYAWSVSSRWREMALRVGSDQAGRQTARLVAVRMFATDQARQHR